MSGTDAEPRPVPVESDAPQLSKTVGRNQVSESEQKDDNSIPTPIQIPDATFVSQEDNPSTPTHASISQPVAKPNSYQHKTHSPNHNERFHPMLEPQAQMRVIHAWMSAMRQVVSLRDMILTARMDVKREKSRCYQQEEFFRSLMGTFMALLNSAVEHGSYLQCKNELDELSRKMKHSEEDLQAMRQRSSDMEDSLSSREYRLTKLEVELYHQIDAEYRMNSIQPTLTSSHTSLETEQQTKANGSASPQAANPRDQLYSRMGDLRILLDRLNEFEYDLRQELDERDLLRATGHIEISDDAIFFEHTRNKRENLQKELEDAQADVERLKRVCASKGIEFEDVHFHSPFYPVNYSDDASSTLSTQEEAARLPLPPSPTSLVGSYFATRERVETWLENGSNSAPLLTGPNEQNLENTSRGSVSSGDWVLTQSWPDARRPSSSRSAGDGKAQLSLPVGLP